MVIEAIVTRLDAAFAQIEATPDSHESRNQRDAIIQWLDSASEHGYRLGLVTTLPAARLSDMFEGQFGRANLDRFSVVVTDANQQDSVSNQHPFDVALQALGVPPERAVGSRAANRNAAKPRRSACRVACASPTRCDRSHRQACTELSTCTRAGSRRPVAIRRNADDCPTES